MFAQDIVLELVEVHDQTQCAGVFVAQSSRESSERQGDDPAMVVSRAKSCWSVAQI